MCVLLECVAGVVLHVLVEFVVMKQSCLVSVCCVLWSVAVAGYGIVVWNGVVIRVVCEIVCVDYTENRPMITFFHRVVGILRFV